MPVASPDPILHLNTLYKADETANKISVGVGAYIDEQGKSYILPVVRKAEKILAADETVDHEYLPIDGLKSFCEASAKLILGEDSDVIKEKRVSDSITTNLKSLFC